ncbi:cellulose biosynthesis cyclic di-GMP-binding regulatory protein BcsB [Enterobacterales bacterium CwR94]|nr:cellulose biosynthesis cyclic di-GMP-binding regulatory protein BcsB [Enterobacterales bacterium CwR94]
MMKRITQISGATALALALITPGVAAPNAPVASNPMPERSAPVPQSVPVYPDAPLRQVDLPFARIAPAPGTFNLKGSSPIGQIEFGVRSDEVVTRAVLNLHYRPSPALLPTLSHFKVYLNDEMVGLVTLTPEQLGKEVQTQLDLDPRFIGDFNRIRFELVGHYTNVCENPAYSSIWLDMGKESTLDLTLQKLPLQDDLSYFPEPFFDSRDNRALNLPMVFAGAPDVATQRAAAILASWFGVKAAWRGQTFPVLYNALPQQSPAIVFATNDQRPDFLQAYPAVSKPTVKILNQPNNRYQKMLLILGRDQNDLVTAVQGIAQGDILLRGQSASVEAVTSLTPRQAYDAPNWVRTDRATRFSELTTFEGQLQADGMQPWPIALSLNLPPDLFLVRARGIDMNIKYRYTSPLQKDNGSRLAIHLNNQFVQDYPLQPKGERGTQLLRIPLIQGLLDSGTQLTIPALQLGVVNELRFNFDYATTFIGGTADGRCETVTPVSNHVVVDGDSTVDFSGYRHYIEMPSLRAFANAGFPFSRYADLSQTLALVNDKPPAAQVTTLLNTLGIVGAQTGYPALHVQMTSDWAQAKGKDLDLLMIGTIPADLREDSRIAALVDAAQSWVKKPLRQPALDNVRTPSHDRVAETQTTIHSAGPMAAIVGFQSPFGEQRSVVALLADSPRAYELLNTALVDTGKRAAIFGSAAIIRESGVHSVRVGEIYHVGHLPWWERLWNLLASHPVWLAIVAVAVVMLFAIMLWRLMRGIRRRRLRDLDDL